MKKARCAVHRALVNEIVRVVGFMLQALR
jgi:hypothetical protein